VTVKHNTTRHQFELESDGETAVLLYHANGKTLFLDHTGVPEALEGRGIGGQLAKASLEFARTEGMEVVPACPFVLSYLRRHPEYVDVVAPQYRSQINPAQLP
jgi:uncharacterized protein